MKEFYHVMGSKKPHWKPSQCVEYRLCLLECRKLKLCIGHIAKQKLGVKNERTISHQSADMESTAFAHLRWDLLKQLYLKTIKRHPCTLGILAKMFLHSTTFHTGQSALYFASKFYDTNCVQN